MHSAPTSFFHSRLHVKYNSFLSFLLFIFLKYELVSLFIFHDVLEQYSINFDHGLSYGRLETPKKRISMLLG